MSSAASPNKKTKISQIDLGIRREDVSHIVQSLSRVMSSTFFLYMKTQGFHWNVTGPNFYSLHKMSEEQYEDLAEAVDSLAERIRALGHRAPSSFSWYEKLSVVKDEIEIYDTNSLILDLIADHESLARILKEGFDVAEGARDHGTADLFVERMRAHEKAAWMLRSLVE